MKALRLFLLTALITACGSFTCLHSGVAGELTGAGQQTASFFKKADYILRVWHDGYWWLQKYSDNGDFITEYIDPVQT